MPLMFQPLARYFDFQGRSRRKEYWLWFLFQIIASFVFSLLRNALGANGGGTVQLLNTAFSLAILIPTIAVSVRRFHDINRTGWWVVFPLAVLIVALIVYFSIHGSTFMSDMQALSNMGPNPSPDQAMAIFSTVIMPMLWVFLVYLAAALVTFVFNVMDGTAGPNRFGADPKGRGNTGVF